MHLFIFQSTETMRAKSVYLNQRCLDVCSPGNEKKSSQEEDQSKTVGDLNNDIAG